MIIPSRKTKNASLCNASGIFIKLSRGSIAKKVIEIIILDTGCGIDKNNENTVFEPFFTTKPVVEGTGLGLSVSKTIIELHHGMISMRNRTDNMQQGVEIKLLFAINGE